MSGQIGPQILIWPKEEVIPAEIFNSLLEAIDSTDLRNSPVATVACLGNQEFVIVDLPPEDKRFFDVIADAKEKRNKKDELAEKMQDYLNRKRARLLIEINGLCPLCYGDDPECEFCRVIDEERSGLKNEALRMVLVETNNMENLASTARIAVRQVLTQMLASGELQKLFLKGLWNLLCGHGL